MIQYRVVGFRQRYPWRLVVCASCRARVGWHHPVVLQDQQTGREVGRVAMCDNCVVAGKDG